MKLRKTDKRFNLYCYGFDCYVEFAYNDWRAYNRIVSYCRKTFGPEFWLFNERVYEPDAKWRAVSEHRNRNWRSKRIYFRGEKYHTLLLMTLPADDQNTYYL
jgi:hypothetical protein